MSSGTTLFFFFSPLGSLRGVPDGSVVSALLDLGTQDLRARTHKVGLLRRAGLDCRLALSGVFAA